MGKVNFSGDFLTPGPLMAQGRPRRFPNLASAAAQMPFLDYVTREALATLILTPTGLMAYVPEAGRFLIHKLAVAAERPQSWATKQRKDVHQVLTLYTILHATDPWSIDHAASATREGREAKAFLARIRRGLEIARRQSGANLTDLKDRIERAAQSESL
ncbi:GSU2403 family nucleotidyltransferase fold protein [Acidiferrobacter sp.]|uniref:GSU2403 family nucleotidyltransferase fold protein n=1 Tax=Acidiferrobacter sp. TaxID=1872107 RepID=UPI00261CE1CC|nr:GSU2403 family nucleotidyltransferase fold protein [Acidiferrobacter sp.]